MDAVHSHFAPASSVHTRDLGPALTPVPLQEFALLVHDSQRQRLHLQVWDNDALLPDRLMGEVDVPLSALDLTGNAVDVWFPVPQTRRRRQPRRSGNGGPSSSSSGGGGGSQGAQQAGGEEGAEAEGLSEREAWRQRLEALRHQQQLVYGSLTGSAPMDKVWQLAARRLHLLRQRSQGDDDMRVHLRITYLRFTQQELAEVQAERRLSAAGSGGAGRGDAGGVGRRAAPARVQRQSRLRALLQSGVLHVHIDRAEDLVARKTGGFTKHMWVPGGVAVVADGGDCRWWWGCYD